MNIFKPFAVAAFATTILSGCAKNSSDCSVGNRSGSYDGYDHDPDELVLIRGEHTIHEHRFFLRAHQNDEVSTQAMQQFCDKGEWPDPNELMR